jgi:hypothetical protein|tara:strand:- start:254 stop:367 length:114 start_codon:yes stop_codon:yes gene_type:complete
MAAADNLPYLIQTVGWLINSSQNYFFTDIGFLSEFFL